MDRLIDTLHYRKGNYKIINRVSEALLTLLLCAVASFFNAAHAASTLNIPNIPIIMASPIHPQVFIAIGNSESMDGNLSGAIMTGSGSLASSLSSLSSSSSPLKYLVPTGFTPPIQGADGTGQAPYTVSQSGVLIDNSPSRLNVAKQGVQAILENYIPTTDFALATYSTSSVQSYNTWVYYMSQGDNNFSFTNTQVAGSRYVINPCYNYGSASSTVSSNCSSIAGFYGGTVVSSSQYMKIGASSDDPEISDVLYSSGSLAGVFLTYTGPTPATPFPPNFSLSNYNSGSVLLSYSKSLPNIGSFATGPTNAGFVPYSKQVIYARRGFGYYGNQSASTGTVLVQMTSAGTVPTTTTVTNALNAFLPYLKPETNSTSTTEIKASALQSPIAGLLSKANSYLSALGTTSGNGCPQQKFVILISDGLPTMDLSGKLWPPLGSAAATGYGVTATFNANGSLNTTNNQALTDAINTIKTLKSNGILTYVIGLGAGVNPAINPSAASTLTAMAVAGGTENYYPATDPNTLVDSLNTIMVAIQNGTFTTSAAAVSSTHLNGETVEYQANFVSSDLPYLDWTGNLVAIQLDPDTGAPTTTINWSAQTQLDNLVAGTGWSSSRFVATWDPVALSGIPFRWASLNTTQKAQLQPSDLLGQNRLEYLRGNTALEKRNGGTFRNRSHILGDIVDSQVIYVGAPEAPYLDPGYVTFAKAKLNRQPMLYVGANDGMVHAINATNGEELFSFIPNSVFDNLHKLTAPLYNQSHQFYVNGSPQNGDVQFSDSTWHTILVGGENAGGNSIYALDITDPSAITSEDDVANSVLWEFTDTDMGLSYSRPQIGQIGTSTSTPLTFAVFFGNGYNSTINSSILYAVNPQTGALIKKIDLCAAVSGACDSTLPQGLSSVALAHKDGLQGQPITVVYAGDLQGNLWAVNVSDADPANWTVRLLFQARDSSGIAQPITTAPIVTLNPNYPRKQGLFILFGTGQLIASSDLLNTQTQTVYGVWDKPLTTVTYARTDLQQQTLSLIAPGTSGLSASILTVTANTINWNNKLGWFADLAVPGQRIITNPELINGTFIATLNTPPLTACGVGFSSMLLELNYLTGGSFLRAQIDINGDGGFTAQDQYNGSYPVGITLSDSYANSPTVLGPNKDNHIVILITQSNGVQTSIINPNNTPRKIGWWQLQ
ncbi:pilus assembly protein [Legionella quateirensis]|uniref:Type IV fimbrial biogenesis PilY1-like protein n=1 Tax=Legionella quateirensis TaxID=45072 RepID=A0A378KU36_9GAMM|nr:PilC/PilY family type IV pilus protein [Legionella quateirensis]KTD45148.1 type IV fimbrial biogenesis PilY1-like protein [Legionella quateirensis]STY17007.1 type IV fimbrial biogenesis PilY1-like protein [Legionella quateirensis]